MESKKFVSNNRNPVVSIALGMALSVFVILMGTLVITTLLTNESIGIERLGVSVLIVTELAVVAGCTFSTMKIGRAIVPVALGTVLGFFAILLSVAALFFGGQYHGVFATLLAVLGSATAVALVILKYMNQPKRYRKKHEMVKLYKNRRR